ncbi:M28 family peptidase [Sphingomonas montana]|uniref:M28 family peptidase n=1 Tax=Sphingomonas montana TaxID=1843236 RepID=UPI00096D6E37|nr:M28 family peptidase [Sphingomonas montana]
MMADGWRTGAAVAAILTATGGQAATPSPTQISGARMSASVKVLASDAFEGRAPGTAGETRTIDWLIAQFKTMGVQPGGRNGSWTQAVPLVRTQIAPGGTIAVSGTPMVAGRDIYVSTLRAVDRVTIANAPMVFVGYGVHAPERQWDDFKGIDLKGKIAVFLVNDPDFEAVAGDDAKGRFGDRRMTYYGRWTYKYEEAARRGAIGALIVHDTAGAGYRWDTVVAPGGGNYDIVQAKPDARVALQGWISGKAAAALFARAGLDLAAERVRARSNAFRAKPMAALTFSANLPVTQSRVESRNVLARIPGRTRPDETVMIGAHWDAYGQGTPDAQGRTVRPGANDDALGVAGVLELARGFAARPAPARSLVFALWSGEERGLLGSETYAVDPIYPIDRTVANLTLDVLQTAGPARDVILVGQKQNALEDDLARAAAGQGRRITPETLPERGLFYRADHFSLARRGVPTILLMALGGGPDLVRGGRAAGDAWLRGYMACYHQTCDAWDAGWDLRGAVADTELVRVMAADLANGTRWPEWRAGSEFDAVRRASAARRQ